ncbi:MAG: hypothetical protein ACREJX_01645 [Polyangiaceae bacterium]
MDRVDSLLATLDRSRLSVLAGVPLVTFIAAKALVDPVRPEDFWWHLRMGRLIVDTFAIPRADAWTFTFHGTPFFDQPWLAQVLFYFFERLVSLAGVIAFGFLVACATEAIVVVASMRRGASLPRALLVQLFVSEIGVRGWSLRPQLFATSLFALAVVLLGDCRDVSDAQARRRSWALPILAIVWANLHGSFPLLFVLIGTTAVATAIDAPRGERARRLLEWIPVSVACFLATLVNPRGLAVYEYVAHLLASGSLASALEWKPLLAGRVPFETIYVLVALLLVFGLALARRARWGDLVMLAPFVLLELRAVRNGIWLSLVLAPIIASWLSAARDRSQKRRDTTFVTVAAIAIALFLPWVKPHLFPPPYRSLFWLPRTPIAAVESIRRDAWHPQRLYTGVGFGSYVEAVLDDVPVFVDSRFELYPEDFVRRSIDQEVGPTVDTLLDEYRFDAWLVDKHREAALAEELRSRPDLVVRYEDDDAVYFTSRPLVGGAT